MTVTVGTAALERLYPTPSAYAARPAAWVTERLGEHLWTRQVDVMEAVSAHRRVAVQSGHGIGKSHIAARTIGWWLDVHPPGTAFVVSTAPTWPQVAAIVWRYVRQMHDRHTLPGRVLASCEWKIGDELVAFGRKPADHDAESAFQGIHAEHVLVVIDEACGIPRPLWDAADSLATSETSRMLAIGNPTDPGSYFAEVCNPTSGWHVEKIACTSSPLFTGEPVPPALARTLVSPTWEAERRREWGERSALYRARVLGEFPDHAADTVVPWDWAIACRNLDLPYNRNTDRHTIGVDVGAGGDWTVAQQRIGPRAGWVLRDHSPESTAAVDLICRAVDRACRETKTERARWDVRIDAIGVGHGIVGHVRERMPEVRVTPVNVGTASRFPKRFGRLRDELWWMARELSRDKAWDLTAVDDDTITQLAAPKYTLDASKRYKVEPKDDTRERLGRSPDDADALILAFYDGAYTTPTRGPDLWK